MVSEYWCIYVTKFIGENFESMEEILKNWMKFLKILGEILSKFLKTFWKIWWKFLKILEESFEKNVNETFENFSWNFWENLHENFDKI